MNIKLTEAQKIRVLNSQDLYEIMQKVLKRENKIDKNREHFWIVGLETNHRILFIELISLGSISATVINPMEVFSLALQKKAVKIVMVHNHPSGNLKPSGEDNEITDRMIQTGIFLKLEVEDHLIITPTSYYSYEDNGLMVQLDLNTKYSINKEFADNKNIKDNKNIEKYATEIGMLKGVTMGKKEAKIEMAKILKLEGVDMKIIMKASGLTKKEIERIK